jgi:hypothetical protein
MNYIFKLAIFLLLCATVAISSVIITSKYCFGDSIIGMVMGQLFYMLVAWWWLIA